MLLLLTIDRKQIILFTLKNLLSSNIDFFAITYYFSDQSVFVVDNDQKAS